MLAVEQIDPNAALTQAQQFGAATWFMALIFLSAISLVLIWWFTKGKPDADEARKRQTELGKKEEARKDAEIESRRALEGAVLSMGQQQQLMNTGIGQTRATVDVLRAQSDAGREAWRIVAKVLRVVGNAHPDPVVRAELNAKADSLAEAMDDDSRLMQALTDEDIARDLAKRQKQSKEPATAGEQ